MADEQEKYLFLKLARHGYVWSACSHRVCVGTHRPVGHVLHRSLDGY